jgi:hypothetical protein
VWAFIILAWSKSLNNKFTEYTYVVLSGWLSVKKIYKMQTEHNTIPAGLSHKTLAYCDWLATRMTGYAVKTRRT